MFAKGKGSKTAIKEIGLEGDFMGLYAFWVNDKVKYVGISKNVITRLCQHIKGTTYHSATLPIKILKTEYPKEYLGFTRSSFTKQILSKGQKDHLHKMKVSFIEVEDDLVLYLFEAYCAIYFKCKYNDFRTH